ncbi:MAG: PKD domain-containing protein [Chitinophagales bacterium]|nr:PKD domain-containing protein [Chitinophagales bacterium]
MKQHIKHLLLLPLLAFFAIALRAQTSCEAMFYATSNPNGVFTFYDSSFAASGYTITNWDWSFGNGNSSTAQNPTQYFSSPGTYNVCLTITAQNTNGSTCVDSMCQSIVYTCPSYINGNFTVTTQQLTAAFTPSFSSNYPPLSYVWHFGDGTSSTTANATHTYTSAGTYNVCVEVSDSFGCSKTVCKLVTVTGGTIACNLAANFTFTQPNKHTIVVTSTTTGGNPTANANIWKLGGLAVGTSSGNNTSYTIAIPNTISDGTYQLCLKVEQPNSNCKDSICKSVTICRANGEFTYSILANDTVQFSTSNTAISNYIHKWYANGNVFATTANPKIKFPNSYIGTTICHVVSSANSIACKDSFCTVLQANPCYANAGFQFATDSNGVTHFSSSVSNQGWDHLWTFGAGTGSNLPNPNVTLAPGTYTVCHRVISTANNACRDSLCQTVIIQNTTPCNLNVGIAQGLTLNGQTVLEASTPNIPGNFTYSWNTGATTKTINVTNNYGTYCVTVTQVSTGCTASSCHVYQPSAPLDTLCGVTFNDLNGNGVLDANESPMSMLITISGNGMQRTLISDSLTGKWETYLPAGTYQICARVNNSGTPSGWVATVPVNQNNGLTGGISCYSITLAPNQNLCGVNFGFQNTRVSICGYVYVDANSNGTKDSGEPGIQGQAVKVGNYTAYTNNNGYYIFNLAAGTHTATFTPASPYTGYTATPANYTVVATTVGQQYCGNDFGIQVPQSQCDVAVTLTPISTVTPGFTAIYSVKVFNLNGVTTGGLLTFNFEPGLTFKSASPVQSSYNNTSATVTWNVSALAPGTHQSFTARLNVPTSLQLGTPIFSFAEFTTNGSCTENNLVNNIDTTHQTVVGSYDPNDKHVSPEGNIANVGQDLVYTIRFQNTGTAPAINVVILDTLSASLNWSSLELKDASHSCNITQEGGLVSFNFSNIMLPDSFHNEPESHGFVSYKIKAQNNLAAGTQITNRAAIYFDYNEAVLTNTTLNTIDVTLNVSDPSTQHVTISVAPNPFKTFTNILVNGANENEPIEIEVCDLAGRNVLKQVSSTNLIQLQAGNLAHGVYVYEVKQNNQTIGKGKMIAE